MPICPPPAPTRLNDNVEMNSPLGQVVVVVVIVRVRTSPPETYVPVAPDTDAEEAVPVEMVPGKPVADQLPELYAKVYVVEPIVNIHEVEDQAIVLELGFDIVIVYVKAVVPEVTFFAFIPTVGVLEVLVVKNPVRAR